MKLIARVAIMAVLCSLSAASDAFACVCAGRPAVPSAAQLTRELKRDLGESLAVFVGEPIVRNSVTLRLRVQAVWKGELGTEVVMATGTEALPGGLMRSSSCDVDFEFGETYLIFGFGKTLATMKAHRCSFTAPVRATEVLGLLDRVAPRRPPSPLVRARRLVAVTGHVRTPGMIEWREGMTVADAVARAGGAVPPVSNEYREPQGGSTIVRMWAMLPREQHPARLTSVLLPDDQLFVAADMWRQRP